MERKRCPDVPMTTAPISQYPDIGTLIDVASFRVRRASVIAPLTTRPDVVNNAPVTRETLPGRQPNDLFTHTGSTGSGNASLVLLFHCGENGICGKSNSHCGERRVVSQQVRRVTRTLNVPSYFVDESASAKSL